jgi:glycosyltransferase involved in cell wall biosynthesis
VLLFPIDWPEPFGLVMIEAMSAGTPVVAWNNGSVPEVIKHGVSGFIVETIDDAVAAVGEAARLPRSGVRRAFDETFSVSAMASRYVEAYRRILQTQPEGSRDDVVPSMIIPGLPKPVTSEIRA